MLMRDSEIKAAITAGTIKVAPFDDGKLQGASYDLTVGKEAFVSNSDQKVILGPNSPTGLHLDPGDFALVLTRECMKLPLDVSCVIGMRSSLARRGLILLAGLQVDPGFQGHLRFGLYNASPRRISLFYGDDLCMLEFHRLSGPVDRPQAPIKELLEGRIPESDRAYLSSLQTTSLSDLSRSVQSMSRSVERLSNQVRWIMTIVVPTLIAILVGVIVEIFNK